MKNILNVFSYVLNVCFIAYFLVSMKDCSEISDSGTNPDKKVGIAESIIEREKADIALKIQKFDRVNKIEIDSFVFTNNVEPYSGYIVSTWNIDEKVDLTMEEWAKNNYKDKYANKDKIVYVEVRNIKESEGTVSWNSSWQESYMDVVLLK